MRRRWRAIGLALLAPLALAQAEPRLVPDVSDRNIEIRYSFTGAELLLFGAIIYPGGQPPGPGTEASWPNFVASTTSSRRSTRASPMKRSLSPEP